MGFCAILLYISRHVSTNNFFLSYNFYCFWKCFLLQIKTIFIVFGHHQKYSVRKNNLLISHMIFSFLTPKYSGVSSLEVLHPSKFLIRLFNQMLCPFIFLIRFSDPISLYFSVYKLAFKILINTYELDFVASTSFTIY